MADGRGLTLHPPSALDQSTPWPQPGDPAWNQVVGTCEREGGGAGGTLCQHSEGALRMVTVILGSCTRWATWKPGPAVLCLLGPLPKATTPQLVLCLLFGVPFPLPQPPELLFLPQGLFP